MKEIVSDEFIKYKAGFISGKHEIIELFKLGKLINSKSNSGNQKKSWYNYGYEDGFNYFFVLLKNNNFNFEEINIRNVIKESFLKRVIKINQNENKEIPVTKFKM